MRALKSRHKTITRSENIFIHKNIQILCVFNMHTHTRIYVKYYNKKIKLFLIKRKLRKE